jgi:hypothetical protein
MQLPTLPVLNIVRPRSWVSYAGSWVSAYPTRSGAGPSPTAAMVAAVLANWPRNSSPSCT